MSDDITHDVPGVDEIIRLPYDGVHLMTYRLRHLRDFPACDALFLDTDVIVRKDMTPLFDEPFDVALTWREQPVMSSNGEDLAKLMPYNTGVMLSKASGQSFWLNAHNYCERLPEHQQKWWGDQLAVKAVADVAPLAVMELPCDLYNYTPSRPDEDLSGKYIVHYKGKRKPWMLDAAGRDNV